MFANAARRTLGGFFPCPYFFVTAPDPQDKDMYVALMRHSEVEKFG